MLDNEEIGFKLKYTTKLEKVMNAYSLGMGIEVEKLRFLFDGTRIEGNSTPEKV